MQMLLNAAKVKLDPYYVKIRPKGRDLTQSYDKRLYTHRKIQKASWQHKKATKNFDYTTIADRLRTVSWSNSTHPTGVVNRFMYQDKFIYQIQRQYLQERQRKVRKLKCERRHNWLMDRLTAIKLIVPAREAVRGLMIFMSWQKIWGNRHIFNHQFNKLRIRWFIIFPFKMINIVTLGGKTGTSLLNPSLNPPLVSCN